MKFASLPDIRFAATQFTIPKGKISKERFIPLMEEIPAEALVLPNKGSAISREKHIKIEVREPKTVDNLAQVLKAQNILFWKVSAE